MKTVTVALLFLVALVATRKDYSGFKVLQVTPENLSQLKALKSLEKKYEDVQEVMFWKNVVDVHRPVSIQLAPEIQNTVLRQLERHGIKSNFIIHDMQKLIDNERNLLAERSTDGSFALDAYHDYDEITRYLKDLSDQYEGTECRSIGQTIEGRDIYMFSIASGDKPAVSIECNIHGGEWITAATCLNLITNLLTNEADKELRDAYDWYFIPIANPDGYVYSWTEDRMWRKNRREQGKCDGVDLNANFDANFGGPGTSSSKCSLTYHGTSAFSEPETQAERDLIIGLKGRLVAHWSFHSFGLLYLLPYCYTLDKPDDFEQLLSVAQASGEAIKNTHGTEFTIGHCASIVYVATGASHDWVYDAASPSFSAVMELRDKGHYGFLLPEDQIMPVFEEVWNGLKAAIDAIQ